MTSEIHVCFPVDGGKIVEADCEVTYKVKGSDFACTSFYWADVVVVDEATDDCEFFNDEMPSEYVEQAEMLAEEEVGKEL